MADRSNDGIAPHNRTNIEQNMKRVLLTIAAVAALLSSCCNNGSNTGGWEEKDLLQIGDGIAIAETQYGKIQGFIYKDVYTFLGVPYGAPTGGANRFMPPAAPEKWEGIRPAVFWGNSAPQDVEGWYTNTVSTFLDHWNYFDISEDCLNLNVWTPGLDGKKRPVMVWFHGGGYSSGNSIEHDEYHGNNFAREEDAVFVSVNHRLNAFGFTDLSAYGEKYAASGNVGVLDLVASLQWVKDNIANFGGDPSNVTIMGQSGGGAKVCTVLAMESAKGLVNKAVALSGSATRAMDQEVSRELGAYVLKEAGLSAKDVDKLQEMPWKDYLALSQRAQARYAQENATKSSFMRFGFAPVEDGVIIPKGGYFQAGGHATDIPVIFSVTNAERSVSMNKPELEDVDKAGAIEYFKPRYGDKAEAIINECEKAFPDMKPIEWINYLDWGMRPNQIAAENAKAAQGGDVYSAIFAYNPPIFNGKLRAFHTMDIAFWYQNTDMMYSHTGGGPEPRALATKMGKTLKHFMETGDPNCGALPQWPKYTEENGTLMWLDMNSKVLSKPDEGILNAIAN